MPATTRRQSRTAPAPSATTDVLIAGSGHASLALAVALKTTFGARFSITIADPALDRDPAGDRRAYAIAAGARRMLETLGVWPAVADSAQPILSMAITDARNDEPVRPLFLTFDGDIAPGEPFAHMVESGALTAALLDRARAEGVDLIADAITGWHDDGPAGTAATSHGARTARLLVAADGGRSRLREKAGIPFYGWRYPQSAIVATVHHERHHGGRAVEHFLPAGPFALLPLAGGHHSSIVWSDTHDRAERVTQADRSVVDRMLTERFGMPLGPLASVGPIQRYPLSLGLARRFIAPRLALLGDAAHVIHPIAGQGLNLGLKDAAALADAIADHARLGLDIGGSEPLLAYERARRFDTATLAATTDILNRLFSNDLGPVRLLRDVGLSLVDRLPDLKRFFIREAAAIGPMMPRLMRGELP
jgi:2-octaprenyl-6-methoxyphenol hydroxylase